MRSSKPARSSSSCSCATRSTPSSTFSTAPTHQPDVGFLGSSNLTFAGLSEQGELNVDVSDHDACPQTGQTGSRIAGTTAGASTSPTNWSRSSTRAGRARSLIPPYHIYLKMAYHLSQEARAGLD